MLFLAEVPAVIAPQDDDGVASVGRAIERIEYAADLCVGKANGGEVALYGGLPLVVPEDGGVVAAGVGEVSGTGGIVDFSGEFATEGRDVG